MEAIACGLPVVTLPGGLMRGRHSHAILTQLGVPQTAARDKDDCVDIAVRLGTDREWRSEVVRRMAEGEVRL
jgi:protein O-GlcNAc transferase